MKPKLLDFKFGDFRDWFVPDYNKIDYTKWIDLLIIIDKNKSYITKTPSEVSSFRIFFPHSVRELKEAKFIFEDILFYYREVYIEEYNIDKCIVTFFLSKLKDDEGYRERSWDSRRFKNVKTFRYEKI